MLTNITPGFYRMRNGNLAFIRYRNGDFVIGYMQIKGGISESCWFSVINGQLQRTIFVRDIEINTEKSANKPEYDLVEKIEC